MQCPMLTEIGCATNTYLLIARDESVHTIRRRLRCGLVRGVSVKQWGTMRMAWSSGKQPAKC